jgi:hypothetical protein
MANDDVADLLSQLPEETTNNLLKRMHKEGSDEVEGLMRVPDDTAGGIMNPDFIALNQEITAKEAIEQKPIREVTGMIPRKAFKSRRSKSFSNAAEYASSPFAQAKSRATSSSEDTGSLAHTAIPKEGTTTTERSATSSIAPAKQRNHVGTNCPEPSSDTVVVLSLAVHDLLFVRADGVKCAKSESIGKCSPGSLKWPNLRSLGAQALRPVALTQNLRVLRSQ